MTWKTTLIAGLLAVSTGAYAAENPFLGTWKLNLAKSHITNVAQQNEEQLVVIAPYGDNGWTQVQIDIREPLKSGREEHVSAKFDGKDYQTNGGFARVISLRRIEDRVLEQITHREGKEISRSRIAVSSDDKTMTIAGNGVNGRGDPYTDNILIYDRLE